MPRTSASDSKTARAIARRSAGWAVAGALMEADGAGVGAGLAAWTTPRPNIGAAAAALNVLTATAANGVMSSTSFRYSIRCRIGHHDEGRLSDARCGGVSLL